MDNGSMKNDEIIVRKLKLVAKSIKAPIPEKIFHL
jgi:hypothetical protein